MASKQVRLVGSVDSIANNVTITAAAGSAGQVVPVTVPNSAVTLVNTSQYGLEYRIASGAWTYLGKGIGFTLPGNVGAGSIFMRLINDGATAVLVEVTVETVPSFSYNGTTVAVPKPTLVAAIGDSITQQNFVNAPTSPNSYAGGYLTWIVTRSDGRAYTDSSLCFGYPGENSGQILAHAPEKIAIMRARGVKICFVMAGTNDVSNLTSTDPDIVVANMAALLGLVLDAGIVPVLILPFPRQNAGGTGGVISAAAQATYQRYVNDQRNLARAMPGVYLVDPTPYMTDYSNASGYPRGSNGSNNVTGTTADTFDGLHPTPTGAFWIADAVMPIIEPLLGPSILTATSPADKYDSTSNKTGNRLANGLLIGTAGTASTGVTGQVADSCTATRFGGATLAIAASKGSRTVGSNTVPTQILVASGGTASNEKMRFSAAAAIAAGLDAQAQVRVSVSGVTAGCLKGFRLLINEGSTTWVANDSTTKYNPDASWTGALTTPVLRTAGGTVTVILEAEIDGTVASNGITVTVLGMTLRTLT